MLSAPSILGDARILVVEDNPINQDVVRHMLDMFGCRNDIAASGPAALDRLSHQRYDLILMDCQMPGMDGYEATRIIRKRGSSEGLPPGDPRRQRVPIVAMTANVLKGDREKCLAAGMDDQFGAQSACLANLPGRLAVGQAPGTGRAP